MKRSRQRTSGAQLIIGKLKLVFFHKRAPICVVELLFNNSMREMTRVVTTAVKEMIKIIGVEAIIMKAKKIKNVERW